MKTNKIFKWIKNHFRPYFRYNPKKVDRTDWKQDEFEDILNHVKNKSEIGFKIKFKF